MPRKSRRPDDEPWIAMPRPAPGELETVQAFVNTAGPGHGTDVFRAPEELARWLTRRGLLAEGSELGEGARRRALEVRRDLRGLLAVNSGAELDPDAVARLEGAAAGARLRLVFDEGGPADFKVAGASLDDALGHLLAAVARARITGRWPLFKLCALGECRRAFFDYSQNHNGLYCTRRCSDRKRTRDYRRRDGYKRLRRY